MGGRETIINFVFGESKKETIKGHNRRYIAKMYKEELRRFIAEWSPQVSLAAAIAEKGTKGVGDKMNAFSLFLYLFKRFKCAIKLKHINVLEI